MAFRTASLMTVTVAAEDVTVISSGNEQFRELETKTPTCPHVEKMEASAIKAVSDTSSTISDDHQLQFAKAVMTCMGVYKDDSQVKAFLQGSTCNAEQHKEHMKNALDVLQKETDMKAAFETIGAIASKCLPPASQSGETMSKSASEQSEDSTATLQTNSTVAENGRKMSKSNKPQSSSGHTLPSDHNSWCVIM